MLNLKNLSEKQAFTYTIIIVIVALLFPLGLLFWVQYINGVGMFATLLENPENLTVRLETLHKEKAVIDATLAKEKRLVPELKILDEETERYKQALPDNENLEDIYKLIGDAIKSVGGLSYKIFSTPQHVKKIIKTSATPQASPATPAPAPITAGDLPVDYVETIWKVDGKYQDILSFMHIVEDVNFKRFFIIRDIRLSPAADVNKEDVNLDYLSAEITFICFFLVKENKPGKAK